MNPEEIAQIAQIASVLEVSGYPKPGNVHRNRDFHDMVYEDFLISGIVIGDVIRKATINGLDINISKTYSEAFLGKYILKAVKETDKWIKNNTNLGILMLLVPISVSAAISKNMEDLRNNIDLLMIGTTVMDAVALYDAINIADAGGMGEQGDYDVNNEDAREELVMNNQTMFDVLAISSSWDTLANELTNKMPVSFEIGFPTFTKFRENNSINTSTVLTFLTILSKVPDTLISRKYGIKKAEEVSNLASELLNSYELLSKEEFKIKLSNFDNYLYENKLNPGTTADLTAASIMLSYLNQYFEKIVD